MIISSRHAPSLALLSFLTKRIGALLILSAISALSVQGQADDREDYYRQWLDQDVVYIITEDEREVFEKLSTAEEKDNFIEQFWLRRDADSNTGINEVKEEHYRRIAYANDNFKSGIDGWKTDRGRIYILHGAPTSIESFPTGGFYQRPMTEGGGATSTYSREVWYYQHIPAIGSGIEMEFVDPTGSGEYKLALRETDKDALLYVPGAGNTYWEDLGRETRLGRIRTSLAMRPLGVKGDPRGNPVANPFVKFEQYMNLTRPRVIQFEDLKTIVETDVYYDHLPFHFRYDVLRYSSDRALCPITLEVSNLELTYQPIQKKTKTNRATSHIYGRVENLGRQVAYEFEDVIHTDVQEVNSGKVLYQRLIPLGSGRYKLHLVLKDLGSEKIGTLQTLLVVPRWQEELSSSTLILADRLLPTSGQESPPDPFVTTSGLKVYPNVQGSFGFNDPIAVYLEVYGFALDQSSSSPSVDVAYEIEHRQTARVVKKGNLTSHSLAFSGEKISIARVWRGLQLQPGQYAMGMNIKDLITGKVIRAEAPFIVE